MFFPEVPSYGRYDLFRRITFDSLEAVIVSWDNEIMAHLRQFPEVRFADFPSALDRYIEQMPTIPKQLRLQDFNFFRQFYFDHNDDKDRLRAIVEGLQS
jgi:hypothetical protein